MTTIEIKTDSAGYRQTLAHGMAKGAMVVNQPLSEVCNAIGASMWSNNPNATDFEAWLDAWHADCTRAMRACDRR